MHMRTTWVALSVACSDAGNVGGGTGNPTGEPCPTAEGEVIPLKEAKLIIEHNATDLDSGFQGFIDSDGWSCLDVTGPNGRVLQFRGEGSLAQLGLTELFFETVEPENATIPLEDVLAMLPEGEYTIEGPAWEAGEPLGIARGVASLTHEIPEGPELLAPLEGAVVPVAPLLVRWGAVDATIEGEPLTIASYQLIIERDADPDPHVIGKRGLSMYLPPTATSVTVDASFLEPATPYLWEVLAIEEGGNQTLSSGSFSTE